MLSHPPHDVFANLSNCTSREDVFCSTTVLIPKHLISDEVQKEIQEDLSTCFYIVPEMDGRK